MTFVLPNNDISTPKREALFIRYKHILDQQTHLNQRWKPYMAIYQAVSVIIFAAIAAVLTTDEVAGSTVRLAVQALSWTHVGLGTFIIISMVSIMFAWMDYRKGEVMILDQIYKDHGRQNPCWSRAWLWQEAWFTGTVAVLTIAGAILVQFFVL